MKTIDLAATQDKQLKLFEVEKQAEVNGIEMGVLSDGTPYLTERGLAKLCGIHRKVLNMFAANWMIEQNKPRGRQIRELLDKSGYYDDTLFIKFVHNRVEVNAYIEPVCLAILEYYAFLAEERRQEAQDAFRSMARITFRAFVYTSVGYEPKLIDCWRYYHDRVDLTKNSVPAGYFCVFHEIASLLIPMITGGIKVDNRTVPDISVGQHWADHWKKNDLAANFGQRIDFDHNYPDYFPQSASNPQPAKAYP